MRTRQWQVYRTGPFLCHTPFYICLWLIILTVGMAYDIAEAQAPKPEAPEQPSQAPVEEGEEEREVTRIPLLDVQRGGLLLPRDTLIVQPTIGYTQNTSTRLIVGGFSVLPLIILGELESERVQTQSLIPALQLRYGIIQGLQADFTAPFIWQDISRLRVSTERAGQVQEGSQQFGIGDISFGLTHQVLYERGWLPDVNLRIGASAPTGRSQFDIFEDIAKGGQFLTVEDFLVAQNAEGSPLGTGRWQVNTSMTMVKALDPAVLFGTLGYSLTPPSTETLIQIVGNPAEGGVILTPQVIERRLGAAHNFNANLGMAVSLNNRLSFNFSFSESITLPTTVDGEKIPGSSVNTASLSLGMTLAVTPGVSVNFSGNAGLTANATDVSFTFSVPVAFYDAVGRGLTFATETYQSIRDALGLGLGSPPPPPSDQQSFLQPQRSLSRMSYR